MPSVPLDDETVASLIADRRLVAVTDRTGAVVGYFAPATSPQDMARRYLGLPDPEDVRRQRESVEKTYTTAEVKAHLRALGPGA